MYPRDLKYTDEHLWVKKVERGRVRVGITQFAANQLTWVTYVQLPEVGDKVKPKERFAYIEMTKVIFELYAPLRGTVVEVNEMLTQTPPLIQEDPYGQGWLVVINPSNPVELDELLSADQYVRVAGRRDSNS